MKIIINGIETELEESDVIKAVKEEYEKQLTEKEKEKQALTEKHEAEEKKIREEHIKQIRAILSGKKDIEDEPEFEPKPEPTLEEKTLESAQKYYKKYMGR